MDLIEELTGTGDLYVEKSETPIRSDVTYRLLVFQRRIPTGRGGSVPGMKRIEPDIHLTQGEIMDGLTGNRRLTLRLDDGRWFDFFVQSSSGNLVAAGGIREAR